VNESADLEFTVACDLGALPGEDCPVDLTLWAAWGAGPFRQIPLEVVDHDTLQVWAASLPASDLSGAPLRYYVEAAHPMLAEPVRRPVVGWIEPAVVDSFTPVDLEMARSVQPDIVVDAPWGAGPRAFGLNDGSEQATIGPAALDVADDGAIAVLDSVNHRLVAIGVDGSSRSFPVETGNVADVEVDESGFAVLDLVGVGASDSSVRIPQLMQFDPDGKLRSQAQVFALQPRALLSSERVLDASASSAIRVIGSQDEPMDRLAQRASSEPSPLRVQVISNDRVRLVDSGNGVAFEMTASRDQLGAVPEFARWDGGYVVIFEQTGTFRSVWIGADGAVISDLMIPNRSYSVFLPQARTSVTSNGDVYILDSTREGVQVERLAAPERIGK
jgi:hypothetical protein